MNLIKMRFTLEMFGIGKLMKVLHLMQGLWVMNLCN
jgi:hypothetical protein